MYFSWSSNHCLFTFHHNPLRKWDTSGGLAAVLKRFSHTTARGRGFDTLSAGWYWNLSKKILRGFPGCGAFRGGVSHYKKFTHNSFNRASWSGGKGTSAEVPAITTSSPGHSGFNIPSVGALDPLRGDSWECGCPDTRVIKKKNVLTLGLRAILVSYFFIKLKIFRITRCPIKSIQ